MILSGLIRKLDLIKSLMFTSPAPDELAFLVSRLTKFCTPSICNSAESSIVIIRSSFGMKLDRAFKNVVLPEPVPPHTKML